MSSAAVPRPFDLSVVIPAQNEAGNIGELIRRARRMIDELGIYAEFIVVDGESCDETCTEAEEAGARAIRNGGRCYGEVLRTGFEHTRGDFILTMDSDLSHEPEFIDRMWALRGEADVIIASRYVPGGRADMSWFRSGASRALNFIFARVLRVPAKDISSGFRLYRRTALLDVKMEARDFDVLEEILIQLHVQGRRIREVPFHYKARKHGKSHVKLVRFGIAYVGTLWKMVLLRGGKN